jgi:hypothetical protein
MRVIVADDDDTSAYCGPGVPSRALRLLRRSRRRSPRDDLVEAIRTAEDTGGAIGGECREQDRNTGTVGCGAVAAGRI